MTTARLLPHHLADLHLSGLSDDTILRSGIFSAPEAQVREILGYGCGSGMVIPYYDVLNGGRIVLYRVRLDSPGPDGKRYRTPKGTGNRLYIPPILDPAKITDPAVPIYVVEGEKKSLKAVQDGLCCLGLAGVWSWKTRANGKSQPIGDLDCVPWRGRVVTIVYDSDLATKAPVQFAEFRLAQELTARGAKVYALRLPGSPQGEKVGLDDFLVSHSFETLCALELVEIRHPALRPAELETFNLAALLRMEFSPEQEIIGEGVLAREGGTILAAESGAGKTMLLLEWALDLAAGNSILGRFSVSGPQRVLFIQQENALYQMQARLAAMRLAKPLPPDLPLFFHRPGEMLCLTNPKDWEAIRQAVEKHRATVLILDPLICFHTAAENDNSAMRRVLDRVTVLCRRTHCAAIISHHFGKPREGMEDVGHRSRGASAIRDWADTLITLTPKKTDPLPILRVDFPKLRNGKPIRSLLIERGEHLTHTVQDEAVLCDALRATEILREELGGAVNSMGELAARIEKVTGTSRATAYRAIKGAIPTLIREEAGEGKRKRLVAA